MLMTNFLLLFIVVAHVGVETTSFASRIDYKGHSLR
jgi:hypothetical protein